MASDIIARGLAARAGSGLKKLEEKIDLFSLGINWKGAVNYESNLPSSPAHGDAYTVKYTGTSGTDPNGQIYVWDGQKTHTWIKFGQDVAEIFKEVKLKQDQLVAGYGVKLTPNTTTRKTTIELSIATFDIKGAKDYYANLPGTGNTEGDLWYVKNDDTDLTHTKGWYCWVTDSGISTWLKIDNDTVWGKVQGDITKQTDLQTELNKRVAKQTTTDDDTYVYGYNKAGETNVDLTAQLNNKLSKVSVTTDDDQLYGKDKIGNQVMVNVESLIKVKDLKFNDLSVIDPTTKTGNIIVKKSDIAAITPEDLTYLQIGDKIYTIKGEATASVASLNSLMGSIVMSIVDGTGTDVGKKFIKLTNGDTTKDQLIEFIQVTDVIDDSNKLTTSKAVKDYCDAKDVKYVELTGTSGTLTDEQRTTLLSGQPTNNFIDKDHMIFKCVFYSAGNKAVYSIAGEAKVHVITVTLPAGTWSLVTYNYPVIDSALSATSTNALQNKVIKEELDKKLDKKTAEATDTKTYAYAYNKDGQTEVNVSELGKVVDVTENGTSILDTTDRVAKIVYNDVVDDSTKDSTKAPQTKAVKTQLDTKLDKKNTAGLQAYVAEGTDQKTMSIASDKSAGTIASRDANGNLSTATPTSNDHATNKKYVDDELDKKVDKETGKGLSTNDYTDDEKTKLAGIAEGAEVNAINLVQVNGSNLTIQTSGTNKYVNVTVAEGTTDGTVAVNGTDVSVHGLKEAAYLTPETALTTTATDKIATSKAIADFVNSSISASAANKVSSDATGDNFATHAALIAGPYYHASVIYTPKNNDYAIIVADETHDNKQYRYKYNGTGWEADYAIGSTFTTAQQQAIDSTITSEKVTKYETYGDSIDGKVNKVSGELTDKQNKLYGTDNAGAETTYGINVDANAWTVGYRDGTGALNVATPTNDSHATTKKYVDDKFGGKLDVLTGAPDGGAYRLPYYTHIISNDGSIITIANETITLDNNKTKEQFTLEVGGATDSLAGLMVADDKKNLDTLVTNIGDTEIATEQNIKDEEFFN